MARAVGQGIRLRFVFAAHAPGYDLLRKQGGSAIDRLIERLCARLGERSVTQAEAVESHVPERAIRRRLARAARAGK